MFVDEVIAVAGGKGGDGALSFRREKYVPLGGPDGGNGGNGGEVILQSAHNLDTLSYFRGKKLFQAADAVNGGSQKKNGKNGEPLILSVPVGTVVQEYKTSKILHDFTHDRQQYIVVNGGRGGYGNSHFTSSTRQAPHFAEYGDQGEVKKIRLVLKLVADVGIIGFPSAGKSTFIAHVSSARPKIADYPFTTLIPNLGVVDHKGSSFVISDNPGLIEGASKGKGLGIQFLKHIERTRILLHMVDISSDNPYKHYTLIQKELERYSSGLLTKKQIIVCNKIDVVDPKIISLVQKKFQRYTDAPLFFISAATGAHINEVLDHIVMLLQKQNDSVPEVLSQEPMKVFRPHLEDPHFFEVMKKKKKFHVVGKRIEQIVRMSALGNREALERVYDVMHKMGIRQELLRQGAHEGDIIEIGGSTLVFRE